MAYTYRRQILCGRASNSTLTNFPLLIKLDSSNCGTTMRTVANGGHIQNTCTQSGANPVVMPADLIFTSDDLGANLLQWEIESYSISAGILWAWVKIPTLSHNSDTYIYVFYGNASVTTQQNTPSNVWDSNFTNVYHLPDGTNLYTYDSTSNMRNGTTSGGFGQITQATGQVDGGISFSQPSNKMYFTVPSFSALTFTGWFKTPFINDVNQRTVISFPGSIPTSNDGPSINVNTSSNNAIYLSGNLPFPQVELSTSSVNNNTWIHFAFIWPGGTGINNLHNTRIFLNGTEDSVTDTGDVTEAAFYSGIASVGDYINGISGGLYGSYDELKLSNTARSADWVITEYQNQVSPLTFNTVSIEGLSRPLSCKVDSQSGIRSRITASLALNTKCSSASNVKPPALYKDFRFTSLTMGSQSNFDAVQGRLFNLVANPRSQSGIRNTLRVDVFLNSKVSSQSGIRAALAKIIYGGFGGFNVELTDERPRAYLSDDSTPYLIMEKPTDYHALLDSVEISPDDYEF